MLKEVEVPQPLGLGIMNLVFAGGPRMTEAGATQDDANGHLLLAGVEVHLLDEPRVRNTKSSRKQVVDLVRHFLSTEFANPKPSEVSPPPTTPQAQQATELHINEMQPSTTHSFFERGEKAL
jgi:hypothetical protein